MTPSLLDYFGHDHQRLGMLLAAAMDSSTGYDEQAFEIFRRALVRHVAIEERVLAPALEARLGDGFAAARRKLRQDHRALVTLVIPRPCREWLEDLRELLAHHFEVEEREGGLHELAERFLTPDAPKLIAAARGLPEVELGPPCEGAEVEAALHAALERFGLADPEKNVGGDPLE